MDFINADIQMCHKVVNRTDKRNSDKEEKNRLDDTTKCGARNLLSIFFSRREKKTQKKKKRKKPLL